MSLPEKFNTDKKLKDFYLGLNEVLEARGMKLLPEDIKVYWSFRMGRAHGQAYYKMVDKTSSEGKSYTGMVGQKIVMNARFGKNDDETHCQATLIHEAAHIWTMTHCGRADHSKAWSHVAQILGDTGERYAGCSVAVEQKALKNRDSVPTKVDALTPREIHSLRTSLKQIDRKYGCGFTLEAFKKYVMPRFIHFTEESMLKAADKLFV